MRNAIPVVECCSVTPSPGVARVLGDNFSAMHQAVSLLVSLGHERIAHLAGSAHSGEANERLSGFRARMLEIFGTEYQDKVVRAKNWGDTWGFREGGTGCDTRPFAEAVLATDVTAVMCANDLFALAVWRLAKEKGLRVPEDISIIGMDNISQGAQFGLTSVSPSFEQIGRAAVDALLMLLEGGNCSEAS